MRDLLIRGWMNLFDRVGGPMTFRIILQPAMATLLAILAGLRDAREGRPPYFWTLLTEPLQRANLLTYRHLRRFLALRAELVLLHNLSPRLGITIRELLLRGFLNRFEIQRWR